MTAATSPARPPALRRIAGWILAAALLLAAALALRFFLIEPRGIGILCIENAPWWCGPRELLVRASLIDFWGIAALGFGALALLLRRPAAAALAVGFGLVGLVLYNAGLASVGFLLGLLSLLRR